MLVFLCACNKPHDASFTDTLPYDSKSGCSWVARLVSGSTGEVGISQTYRADETYALMGADGVIENVFTGLTPGIAIDAAVLCGRFVGRFPQYGVRRSLL